MIIHGDSLEELSKLESETIDLVCTDPPYGYSFMGKDWDKAVPSVKVWAECLRVLKPGAFAMVMSAPRSDVQMHMIKNLSEAGFRLDFTPIYWTYASGFPKAGNISKLVDKRMGIEREVIGIESNVPERPITKNWDRSYIRGEGTKNTYQKGLGGSTRDITIPSSDQAKALDGSYAGFQPKPAVEVIIIAMKPLNEKTHIDQALANGHGISWFDNVRIPVESEQPISNNSGRFPANLLVSDFVLSNDYSRYFDLDKWADTLPFLIVPKASKSEKNSGLDEFPRKPSYMVENGSKTSGRNGKRYKRKTVNQNSHPTVKPLKLMSYLITLGSRQGDVVLDPFCGSGTTCIAAKKLKRKYIGIEREAEYVIISQARLDADKQLELV